MHITTILLQNTEIIRDFPVDMATLREPLVRDAADDLNRLQSDQSIILRFSTATRQTHEVSLKFPGAAGPIAPDIAAYLRQFPGRFFAIADHGSPPFLLNMVRPAGRLTLTEIKLIRNLVRFPLPRSTQEEDSESIQRCMVRLVSLALVSDTLISTAASPAPSSDWASDAYVYAMHFAAALILQEQEAAKEH